MKNFLKSASKFYEIHRHLRIEISNMRENRYKIDKARKKFAPKNKSSEHPQRIKSIMFIAFEIITASN